MNHLSTKLRHVMKSGFYTTTGDDQLSGWTKKKLQSSSQSQTCTKTTHGHCLVVSCLSDPLQLSESWQNHYIWKVCSAVDEMDWKVQCLQPALVNTEGPMPECTSHSQHFRSWTNRATKFCLIHYIHLTSSQSTTTFFKQLGNFLQGKHLYNQQEAENAFQEFSESRSMDFYSMGISKCISHWQKCFDCNGSCFD